MPAAEPHGRGREAILSPAEEERAVDYLVLAATLRELHPRPGPRLNAVCDRLTRLLGRLPEDRREGAGQAVVEGIRRVRQRLGEAAPV